ncbi:MAG: glutathione S-transferase N-terminal domain-containing protein [Pseudomonadota bacterium]
MTGNRLIWHTFFLYSLPFLLLWLDGGLGLALVLVLVALLARWAIGLSVWVAPAKVPAVQLDSIAVSHFVEKVRWCLDRLGIDYVEKRAAGTLGAFTVGRTVPRLKFSTGAVRSEIGNSAEILRYLYGRYAAELGADAEFLAPTKERVALEQDIDAIGVLLQQWVYYHVAGDREAALAAWGARDPRTPAWQRLVIRVGYPLLSTMIKRAFRVSAARHEKVLARLTDTLGDFEDRLRDGRNTLLAGPAPDYCDFAFAAINSVWLRHDQFARGTSAPVRLAPEKLPEAMRNEIKQWSQRFPKVVAHFERLYREERLAHA